MPYEPHGTDNSAVEVQNVGQDMLWVYADRKEYCLPYDTFPEFLQARLHEILNVRLTRNTELHWPALGLTVPLETLQESTEVVPRGKGKQEMERRQLMIAAILSIAAVVVVLRALLGFT